MPQSIGPHEQQHLSHQAEAEPRPVEQAGRPVSATGPGAPNVRAQRFALRLEDDDDDALVVGPANEQNLSLRRTTVLRPEPDQDALAAAHAALLQRWREPREVRRLEGHGPSEVPPWPHAAAAPTLAVHEGRQELALAHLGMHIGLAEAGRLVAREHPSVGLQARNLERPSAPDVGRSSAVDTMRRDVVDRALAQQLRARSLLHTVENFALDRLGENTLASQQPAWGSLPRTYALPATQAAQMSCPITLEPVGALAEPVGLRYRDVVHVFDYAALSQFWEQRGRAGEDSINPVNRQPASTQDLLKIVVTNEG